MFHRLLRSQTRQIIDRRLRDWRKRGLLHRVPRALPSCSRRHLPLTAYAWLALSRERQPTIAAPASGWWLLLFEGHVRDGDHGIANMADCSSALAALVTPSLPMSIGVPRVGCRTGNRGDRDSRSLRLGDAGNR
jgi:hypothetical protein